MFRRRLLAVLPLFMISIGCLLPQTTVIKHPGPGDTGVRYYRPKPYLMITPMINKGGEPVPGFVSLETKMLPDYAEEYSIHVRSGLGVNQTQIKLDDGWNLTALNVDVDSKTAENLSAIADVVDALPVPTSGDQSNPNQLFIRASNVPLGLYESVVDQGQDCQKRLAGFRYVGFLPYAASTCQQTSECQDATLYGLVFDEESRAMVFRRLDEIPFSRLSAASSQHPVERLPATTPVDDPDTFIDDNSAASLDQSALQMSILRLGAIR